MRRFVLALALLGAAGVPSLPLADSAMAGGPFDGAYVGYQRETKNNNYGGYCKNGNQDNIRITITDSTIGRRWGGVVLKATIAPDGSFSTSAAGWAGNSTGAFLFNGRIVGANLEADVGNSSCAAHISMKKV